MTDELNRALVPCGRKPLEWSSEPPYTVARVAGGHYAIECVQQGIVELRGSFLRKDFDTFGAAVLAAQMDHEQHVRAIEAQTNPSCQRPGKDGAPCDCALQMGNDYFFLPHDACLHKERHP